MFCFQAFNKDIPVKSLADPEATATETSVPHNKECRLYKMSRPVVSFKTWIILKLDVFKICFY